MVNQHYCIAYSFFTSFKYYHQRQSGFHVWLCIFSPLFSIHTSIILCFKDWLYRMSYYRKFEPLYSFENIAHQLFLHLYSSRVTLFPCIKTVIEFLIAI